MRSKNKSIKIRRSWIIIVGVLAIVLVAAFVWQQNIFSKEVLKLEILVPGEADMGQEVVYTVKYKNNGNVRLEDPTLIFEYPGGAVFLEGDSRRVTQELDDIYPGQERTIEFPARLFGKKDEVKEAKAQITYTPKNLTGQFSAETTASTVISFVPINFELDLPSRIESSQAFEFSLNYFSNSEYPLSNMRISIDYPEGFTFKSASPASIGESEWSLGLVNRAEGGRITIVGALEGELNEAKIFRARIGSWEDGTFTLFKESVRGVEIAVPQLLISQRVNDNAEFVALPGDTLHYEIYFKNVSDKNLENLFLVINLDGRPLDLLTLRATYGTSQQGGRSILWESRDVGRLRFLGKGDEGRVEFWVDVAEEWEQLSSQDKDFSIKTTVVLSDIREEFSIPVSSKLSIEQTGYFQDEVFGNQGPLPPQVETPTTYTITWTASNLYSDVHNVKVKASLAQGVQLSGNIFPQDSSLVFDSVSREVIWDAGDIVAGAGTFGPAASVSFQISFTPQEFQIGTTPELIGEARITGDDIFTNRLVSSANEAITTALPDDESVTPPMGVVQ
ncbi:MAG TPA: hypothetical protein ENI04_01400 [Candidatus Wildermuthbacteria bacterium]|nr:hypothetical protein [Candidatus Wildermuthbacteria bacterium]